MGSFILRRLLAGVVLIFVISSIVFFMLYASSGDIARNILGQNATQEAVQAKAVQLGLDKPLLNQYFSWLGNAVTGDLGTSYFTNQAIVEAVTSRLSVTLSLVLGATLLAAVVSVVLGVWAALKRGWVDKMVQAVSIVGYAVPNFLIAVALVTVFAINLAVFQPTGYINLTDSFSGWIETVTLPIIALSLGGIAGVTGQVRGAVVDALRQDYVRTLRSRGLPNSRVVFKHVLRNAGGPALSVLGVQFVGLLGGAVIVENIFAIPGIGQAAVLAASNGDVPTVMGVVVIAAIVATVVNLLIDLAQGWLNPKVRVS